MIFTIPGTDTQIDIDAGLLQEMVAWSIAGAPAPAPDIVKKMTLIQYAKAFGAVSFIETGTFTGTTTWLMAHYGLQCKSIELSEGFYRKATRFLGHLPNVELVHGDSAELLGALVGRTPGPHLFWLDGHYSAGMTARGQTDTPILRELEQLRDHDMSRSVILIDDLRDFGRGSYPSVNALTRFAAVHWPNHVCEVFGDMLRITPAATLSERQSAGPYQDAA
jgi:hypothetical protein